MASGFKQFDHTADVGICVEADTLPELFAESARGMFSLIAESHSVAPDRWQEIHLAGEPVAALLVNWLRELLYIHEVEDRIFTDFRIHDVSENGLHGAARSGPLDEATEVLRQVKAITYHALEVKQTSDGWHAQVLFDT